MTRRSAAHLLKTAPSPTQISKLFYCTFPIPTLEHKNSHDKRSYVYVCKVYQISMVSFNAHFTLCFTCSRNTCVYSTNAV